MKGKNIFKAFVLMISLLLVFSIKVNAATNDVIDIKVSGMLDYTKAQEVLSIVNEERKKEGLDELKMDNELMESAMIRASEIGLFFSHTRPNGTSCYTVSSKVRGENIAAGSSTATGTMNQWMNSAGHRANILTSSYKSIGIGVFKNGSIYYWVQLFSTSSASEVSSKTGTIEKERAVSVIKDDVSVYAYVVNNWTTYGYLQPGQTGYFRYGVINNGWDGVYSPGVASDYNFTSSNSKIVSIDSNGNYTAKSVGTATVKGCLKADNTKCFSEEVTVQLGANFTGAYLNSSTGKYEYYTKGKIDTTINGLKKIEDVWYYFTKGIQDNTYNGVATNEFGTWYVDNGTITRKHTEVVFYKNKWYTFINSKLDLTYTGICSNKNGTWYAEKGIVSLKYNGTYKDAKGRVYVIVNSGVDTKTNGLKKINNTWYYFKNGVSDLTYNGVATNEFGTWYVDNGIITRAHNEVVQYKNKWYAFVNSKLDLTYTGLSTNKNGTWYAEKGIVSLKYNGTYKDSNGKIYVIANSGVDTKFNGLKKVNSTWYYFTKGVSDFTYSGAATNEFGTWYVDKGIITRTHNEVVFYKNKWYAVVNSKFDLTYTGICSNKNGTWYAEKGIVSLKYNGTYKDSNGKVYTIKNSRVMN